MSGCIDKRFGDRLHAYELGMLDDEQRREMELHLLVCPHCFARLQKMQTASKLMRRDPDVRQTIGSVVEGAGETDATPAARKKPWIIAAPAVIAAFVVVLLLVLKPWQIEFKPSLEAIAGDNRLAIMYFDNMAQPADSGRLGEIITSLLVTDLAESQYLQVISTQQLYDVLRSMDREDSRRIDRTTAFEIARKVDARWLIMGSILQTDPVFIVTAQLVETASGNVRASQRITGDTDDTIFSLVDKLTAEIKSDLTLPEEAGNEPDRPVADVTTHSPDAYRYYLIGVENYGRFYMKEAAQNFRQALTCDSTMAMAYYYLAYLVDRRYADTAYTYIDRVSQKERYYIMNLQAILRSDTAAASAELRALVKRYPDEKMGWFKLGQYEYGLGAFDKAVDNFNRAIGLDPLYKPAYNMLAYTYDAIGDYEQALWAINTYIEMAPGEANPYDTRGDLYAKNGNLDGAIDSYKKAVGLKPDFATSLEALGRMYIFRPDYQRADSCFAAFMTMGQPFHRISGRLYRSYIPVRQGKLDEALQALDAGLAADSVDLRTGPSRGGMEAKLLLKSRILVEQGKIRNALDVFDVYRSLNPPAQRLLSPDYRNYHIQLLMTAGDSLQALEVVRQLKEDLEAAGQPLYRYRIAMGYIELAQGRPESALEYFNAEPLTEDDYNSRFWAARALIDAGKWESAAAAYESLFSVYSSPRAFSGIMDVKAHYYLGLAYERLQSFDKAAEQYRIVLDLWKDATHHFAELTEARNRLQKITAGTS